MKLAIIIPCYNEEEILPKSINELNSLLKSMIDKDLCNSSSRLLFVDDGSKDKTWQIIEETSKKDELVEGIKLSRNYGHQNALIAGLSSIEADAYVTIDADLQDDANAIKDMIKAYHKGFEIVYGVRKERKSDTLFKRQSAHMFYKLMDIMGVETVYNHADFRLLSSRAKDALMEFKEVNLFLRGIIPLIGFKTTTVYYARKERYAGESKYPLKKMLSFAWEGITSFSTIPLRLITTTGFIIFIISIIYGTWVLYEKLFTDHTVQGWASMMVVLLGLGGIQVLSLGIIGEYIGKIYKETKQRPRYFIDKTTEDD